MMVSRYWGSPIPSSRYRPSPILVWPPFCTIASVGKVASGIGHRETIIGKGQYRESVIGEGKYREGYHRGGSISGRAVSGPTKSKRKFDRGVTKPPSNAGAGPPSGATVLTRAFITRAPKHRVQHTSHPASSFSSYSARSLGAPPQLAPVRPYPPVHPVRPLLLHAFHTLQFPRELQQALEDAGNGAEQALSTVPPLTGPPTPAAAPKQAAEREGQLKWKTAVSIGVPRAAEGPLEL